MEKILDKFLRYVSYDTASDPDSPTQPSTQKQLTLLNVLLEELKAMGINDATLDQYGYVMATIPSNTDKEIPPIGFIAHVDTSPDMPGASVKPQVIPNYNGQDICLNPHLDLWLRINEFPELTRYIGQTIVTTDGTTLLGADDKAGVAEIMCTVEYLMAHQEIPHGPLRIAFTPDEEIGRGVDKFDVAVFGACYAYTIDGGEIGEIEYENFNAALAKIHIQGRNVHPGYAKNKMLNALLLGMEINSMLPADCRPELTQGYEGFFHITSFRGTVEEADIQYIIRDHSFEKFKKMKKLLDEITVILNAKYGAGCIHLEMTDQYFNMRKQIEPHFHIVERALKAMEQTGVKPLVCPVRGGTDGAQLSFRGLPCPNLFTGGHNFHGKYEYVVVESMEKAVEVLIQLASCANN